jgi:23S rRNA (cytosine1962-C5)-methyltransferase
MRPEHFRRYQLNKQTSATVAKKHPWICSGQLSTASDTFSDGEFLRLVDTQNQTCGFGVFLKEERVAIRVLHFGDQIRNRFFFKRLKDVLQKRLELLTETNSLRLINGELDGIPGITVDLYGNTAVILFYARGLYKFARMISLLLPHAMSQFPIENILIRPAAKTTSFIDIAPRVTRGKIPREVRISEFGLQYAVDVRGGQKGGFFLDLRGARRLLKGLNLSGMRVLNLFGYTGAMSLIAMHRGAESVTTVEQSPAALKLMEQNIQLNQQDPSKHIRIQADVFDWLKTLPAQEKFDLILIDPPSLATKDSQIEAALVKMEKLHELALSHLKPESAWISCCCTRRIQREPLVIAIGKASKRHFGKGTTRILAELAAEPDHGTAPKSFPEGNYLQVLMYSNSKS